MSDRHNSSEDELAGARAYERLSEAKKALLLEQVTRQSQADDGAEASSLPLSVTAAVDAVLARRARLGESLEAEEVVREVVPLVRSQIPQPARERVFREIIETFATPMQ